MEQDVPSSRIDFFVDIHKILGVDVRVKEQVFVSIVHFLNLFPFKHVIIEFFIFTRRSLPIITLLIALRDILLSIIFVNNFILLIAQYKLFILLLHLSFFKFFHLINIFITFLIKVFLPFTLYNLTFPGRKFFLKDLIVESFIRRDWIKVGQFEFLC